MGQMSQRKGATFERQVAKDLSLAISNGADKVIFERRTAMSGGKPADKDGSSGLGGDIMPIKEPGHSFCKKYIIECKSVKDLRGDLWNFIAGNNINTNPIIKYIEQATAEAKVYERKFILIMKCNQAEPLVITDDEYIIQTDKGYFFERDDAGPKNEDLIKARHSLLFAEQRAEFYSGSKFFYDISWDYPIMGYKEFLKNVVGKKMFLHNLGYEPF